MPKFYSPSLSQCACRQWSWTNFAGKVSSTSPLKLLRLAVSLTTILSQFHRRHLEIRSERGNFNSSSLDVCTIISMFFLGEFFQVINSDGIQSSAIQQRLRCFLDYKYVAYWFLLFYPLANEELGFWIAWALGFFCYFV